MAALILGVFLVGVLEPSAFIGLLWADQGVVIKTITPSAANVGDQVTITGSGFGAHNVRITVGSIAAQVLAATGNSATFLVPAGVKPGPTTVTATNPGGKSGSIAFVVLGHPPTANAGPDQTVFVATTVQLDGSGSTDVDGDPLTFRWSFVSMPTGSAAVLSDSTAVRPTFLVDHPGTYVVQLVVNDGQNNSLPDTVRIDTQNSPPVARAGPDQTIPLGEAVQLNGSTSSDVDGDPLTFRWAFVSQPSGSHATLTDAAGARPSFIADLPGRYILQLVVNDGVLDSVPDTVQIDTQNSRPLADAGPDQLVTVGATVQLDGSVSSDADGDPLRFRWSFTTFPNGSTASLSDVTIARPTFVPDLPGIYVGQLIVNDGFEDSLPDTVAITGQLANHNQAPVAVDDAATTGRNTAVNIAVLNNDSDPDGDTLTVTGFTQGTHGTVSFTANVATYAPSTGFGGTDTFTYTISDGQGGSASATVTVRVNEAPVVTAGAGSTTIILPAQAALTGTVSDDGLPNPPATVTTTWSKLSGPGSVSFGNASALNTTASFSQDGAYVLRLSGFDGQLTTTADVSITVMPAGGGGGLPPDPSTVAPPLDLSVASTIGKATEFLYTGPNPIQTGVAPGTIDPRRAAVIRGTVLDKNNQPLPGVTITILGHPEFGQTLSRADGMFDMAVNGGGYLTITYSKVTYFTAQRQVTVPWQDFVMADDVILVQPDPQVSTVDLTSTAPVQVVRGSVQSDADGTRQAILLFPQGTQAQMFMPDGTQQPISTLSVRATEFTVGPNGPKSMPAELPPTSGYTYAVVFTADEAKAAGAKDVVFATPIPFYLGNFLNFPVGTVVPLGSYDADKGQWVAADSGLVIKILSVTSGLANLDTTGSGTADNGVAIGISDAERQQLAHLYAAGQTLWRVTISHFDQPWDANWGFVPPPDAGPLSAGGNGSGGPQPDPKPDDPQHECASIIECESQVLGETISIAGTPFSLNYRSDRVVGRVASRTLDITLSVATVPASLKRIDLEVTVAGRVLTKSFPPQPNQSTRFTWDGKDAYGRAVQGSQPATVRVGYTYNAVYQPTSRFGYNGNGTPIGGNKARGEVTFWTQWQTHLGTWDARAQGLGGWSFNIHHAYDLATRLLYLGNGDRRSATVTVVGAVITTVAGTGGSGSVGDGGPATKAQLNSPTAVAAGPDGSLYIADTTNNRVRRVGSDGIITTATGTGDGGFTGDGGPATKAQLNSPGGLAAGPDGSLYIADTGNNRIRRVAPDGIITTVAGTGNFGFTGDGGPAKQADVSTPVGVAVTPDGNLYIADTGTSRIRRVGPEGIITTVAGTGNVGSTGDGGPATQARLANPWGIAVASDGSLYIADTGKNRIRRVGPDGIITTVVGTSNPAFGGDGGLATQAQLNFPTGVAMGPDGNLYIADTDNGRIRQVGGGGTIITVAGTGDVGFGGDGGPSTQAQLNRPMGVVMGSDGNLYIADSSNNRIRQTASPSIVDTIAAEDGSELYVFTPTGRHLRSLDAFTGAIRYTFTYDDAGRLVDITDGDGNVTTIERDANGNPAAIVAPFGQRTVLTLDTLGYLTQVTNPADESVQLSSNSGVAEGLLATFTDPLGNIHHFEYDDLGRLIKDTDPSGGVITLARTQVGNSTTVSVTVSPGLTTTYLVENLPTREIHRVTTNPAGATTDTVIGTDGSRRVTYPNGTSAIMKKGPDPRWGMQAPIIAQQTVTTPGGISATIGVTRVASTDPLSPTQLTSQTDTVVINGRSYSATYRATGRVFTLTTPEGRQLTGSLDALSRPLQVQASGLAPGRLLYDTRGHLSSIRRGVGRDERSLDFTYNTDGFLQTVTDNFGPSMSFARDPVGRIVTETLPGNRILGISYDPGGNLTSITLPGGSTHGFTYTPTDLLASYVPPDIGAGGTQTQYSYNTARQLTHIALPDTEAIDLTYDDGGRLSTVTVPQGLVKYVYDGVTRRIKTATTPDGIQLSYDYDGRLLKTASWSGPVTGMVSHGYDNNFRVNGLSVDGGSTINFEYDKDGLLTRAGSLTLTRDAQNGLLAGTVLSNVTTVHGANGFGELTSVDAKFGTAPLYSVQYSRDNLGRVTQMIETLAGTITTYDYSYEIAGRLAAVQNNGTTVASYTYDAEGNRLSYRNLDGTVNGTYDAQDRLMQYGETSYTYTPNGDLQTKTAGNQITTYEYDVLGNLRAVMLPGGTRVEYLVDARNRRIGKEVNGIQMQGLLYADQLRPVAALDGNNNVISTFIYAGVGMVPIYMIKGGVTYRILTDQLGSPRLVVDVATGALAQRMDYDEFGRVIMDTNPGFQPFGFTGGLYDPDTRLVRLGARDYDAETGRWTTKDPLGLSGSLNIYAYVRNDPINLIDRTGRAGEALTWGTAFSEATAVAAGVSAGAAFGAQGIGLGLLASALAIAIATDHANATADPIDDEGPSEGGAPDANEQDGGTCPNQGIPGWRAPSTRPEQPDRPDFPEPRPRPKPEPVETPKPSPEKGPELDPRLPSPKPSYVPELPPGWSPNSPYR